MHLVPKILLTGFLLSGSIVQAKPKDFALSHTLVNYRNDVTILVDGARTDRGEQLPFDVILQPSSNPRLGTTAGGLGQGPGLPEWVEIHWREKDPGRGISFKEWSGLDAAARAARAQKQAALPVKSAKVVVRSLVPESVVKEVETSPPDPDSAYLPLKSLSLYFIWTRDGVKVRWALHQGCCTVVREGGDSLGK